MINNIFKGGFMIHRNDRPPETGDLVTGSGQYINTLMLVIEGNIDESLSMASRQSLCLVCDTFKTVIMATRWLRLKEVKNADRKR